MNDRTVSRRRVLQVATAGAAGIALPSLRPRFALSAGGPPGDALVFVFLRGGMDGLTAVVPVHDREYYGARRSTAVPAVATRPLDSRFGLHPALAPIHPIYTAGQLAFVHAVGIADGTRSHFDAQAAVERSAATGAATGWLGRHLATIGDVGDGPDAIAVGSLQPTALHGGDDVAVIRDLADLALSAAGRDDERRRLAALEGMWSGPAAPSVAGRASRGAVRTVRELERLRRREYQPAKGVTYPTSPLGRDLKLVAQLLKADLGVAVAHVDVGGWDLHAAMGGATSGPMTTNLDQLARGIAAFWADLGDRNRRVTLVAVSEFGRHLRENGSAGLDHGRGGVAMVIGHGIHGGRVHGRWPGLAPDQLEDGDLAVTTDVRDVLAEIVAKRLRNSRVGEVFPGHRPTFLGLARG